MVEDRTPGTNEVRTGRFSVTNAFQAIREVHQRYSRYARNLKGVRTIDDLVDLNRAEFGSALAGGENVSPTAVLKVDGFSAG